MWLFDQDHQELHWPSLNISWLEVETLTWPVMSVKAHYNVKEHHLDIQIGPFRMIILPPMLHPETKKNKNTLCINPLFKQNISKHLDRVIWVVLKIKEFYHNKQKFRLYQSQKKILN
jgi:hypothetical protein